MILCSDKGSKKPIPELSSSRRFSTASPLIKTSRRQIRKQRTNAANNTVSTAANNTPSPGGCVSAVGVAPRSVFVSTLGSITECRFSFVVGDVGVLGVGGEDADGAGGFDLSSASPSDTSVSGSAIGAGLLTDSANCVCLYLFAMITVCWLGPQSSACPVKTILGRSGLLV